MDNAFGNSRLATEREIGARIGDGAGGLYVGHYYDAEAERAGREIRYQDDRHVVVFGPTGSGKSKRFLVPALTLSLEDRSVIVIDPKGELAHMTAEYRRSLGHEVVVLNPFGVLGLESAGFNPLAGLDPEAPTFYDDAAAIGEALIRLESKDPHWSESAQGLITGLVMWEKIRRGDKANLENVRRMLTENRETEWVKQDDGSAFERDTKGLPFTAALMVDAGGYQIASLAARFTRDSPEIASIQSTGDTQTRWLLSSPIRADLKKRGVDFGRLKDRPTTVYVVLPAERLRTHSVWLRLVIVSALRALYRPGKLRTTLLIDEMAALGHLPPLEDAFGLVRGYGVQIAAILQDLPQLESLYDKRWETFLANAGVVFGFAPNDRKTSEWMSWRSGQRTVVAKGFSQNTGTSVGDKTSTSSGSGASDQQIARPLFLPHELMTLPDGVGMLWLAGAQTVPVFMPYYEKIARCRERVKPSPYDAPGLR